MRLPASEVSLLGEGNAIHRGIGFARIECGVERRACRVSGCREARHPQGQLHGCADRALVHHCSSPFPTQRAGRTRISSEATPASVTT